MDVPPARAVRLLALLVWHQGLRRPELRGLFWRQLWQMARQQPRQLARERIGAQLGHDPLLPSPAVATVRARAPALAAADRAPGEPQPPGTKARATPLLQ